MKTIIDNKVFDLCRKIIEDGKLTEDEVYDLSNFINKQIDNCDDGTCKWPNNLLIKPLQEVWQDGALDSKFSSDPKELALLIKSCREAKQAIGVIKYGPTTEEKKSIKKRRSLFFVKDVLKSEIISKNDIGSFRPALGLETKFYKKIIGKRLLKVAKYGDPIKKNFFKK